MMQKNCLKFHKNADQMEWENNEQLSAPEWE